MRLEATEEAGRERTSRLEQERRVLEHRHRVLVLTSATFKRGARRPGGGAFDRAARP